MMSKAVGNNWNFSELVMVVMWCIEAEEEEASYSRRYWQMAGSSDKSSPIPIK